MAQDANQVGVVSSGYNACNYGQAGKAGLSGAAEQIAAQKALRSQEMMKKMEEGLGLTQAAPVSQAQAAEQQEYCNRALANVEKARYPDNLPDLTKIKQSTPAPSAVISKTGSSPLETATSPSSSPAAGGKAYTDAEKLFLARFLEMTPQQRSEELDRDKQGVTKLVERNFNDALAKLPPDAQKKIIEAAREKALSRQQAAAKQYGGKPEDYTQYANPNYYKAVEAGNYYADTMITRFSGSPGQPLQGAQPDGQAESYQDLMSAASMLKSTAKSR